MPIVKYYNSNTKYGINFIYTWNLLMFFITKNSYIDLPEFS